MYAFRAPWAQNSRLSVAVVVGIVLGVAGCGGKTEKLVPVSGKVTVGNELLTMGTVTLFPEGADVKDNPGAIIDSTGHYEVTTNGKKGAPLGKYRIAVMVSAMPPMGPGGEVNLDPGKKAAPSAAPKLPSLPPRYANPDTSGQQYEVVESPAPGQYDLSLAK